MIQILYRIPPADIMKYSLKMQDALRAQSMEALNLIVEELKKETRTTFKKGSGELERGWKRTEGFVVAKQAGTTVITYGIENKEYYAEFQNIGGRVVPIRARSLAIPQNREARSIRAKDFMSYRGGIFVQSRRGKAWLYKEVEGNRLDLGARMYRLVRGVTIPATHYIDRALASPRVLNAMDGVLQKFERMG